MAPRVLFIGGTGTISSACSDLALQRGNDLTLLNRARNARSGNPPGTEVIDAHPERQRISDAHNQLSDRLIAAMAAALSSA